MRIFLSCRDEIKEGVLLLQEELGITLCDADTAELYLAEERTENDILKIVCAADAERKIPRAAISFCGEKVRFFRGLGIVIDKLRQGITDFTLEEHPTFRHNGAMFDVSRNSVLTVESVKFTMRKMALMGLNTYMLYTEDTYEVPERPYFGYMRGRYTQAELRELDAYAVKLGIELIPCIQTLGHLATYLRWKEAKEYTDTANALLPGVEETRQFICDLFASLSASFSSRKVHIGMDETHDLGTGASLDRFGYHPRKELYLKQLAMVVEVAKQYGFHPMMWSDMFFRLSAEGMEHYGEYDLRTKLLPDIQQYVPKDVQQVFWDYYHDNTVFYEENLKKHLQLCDDPVFAGGVWAWSGHAVQYSRSIRNSVPALDACRKMGTRTVIATIWTNGAEAFHTMALAGLQLYAEYDYHGHYDEAEVALGVQRCLGVPYADFLKTEDVEYPHGDNRVTGASKVLLYNDPLCGLMDRQVSKTEAGAYYRALSPQLKELCSGKGVFAGSFEILYWLSALLEHKADFGVRLKAAYDAQDRTALQKISEEIEEMQKKLRILRELHRAEWMKWYKPFGWEVLDIRYGGIDARLDTAKYRIREYLENRIDRIGELEETRLRFDCADDSAPAFGSGCLWAGYSRIATAGRL